MGFFRDALGLSDKSAARRAAQNVALRNFTLTGPGGMSVGFTPTSGNVALGSLDPIRAMLLGQTGSTLAGGVPGLDMLAGSADEAQGGLMGLDPSLIGILQTLAARQVGTGSGAPGLPPQLLAALGGTASGQLGSGSLPPALLQAVSGLRTSPTMNPALMAGLSEAALSRLGTAGASPDAVAADRLSLLRSRAQPFEQEFIQKSIGDLFAKGRFGSNDSMSGKVSEGVTRALSGADLERQIAAQDFGRASQSDAVSQALNLTGGANALLGDEFQRALGIVGAEQGVFDSAQAGMTAETGRFGNLVSLLEGSLGNQFDRSQAGMNSEVDRMLSLISGAGGVASGNTQNALNRFNIAQQLFDSTQAGENATLGRAMGALGGVQGIDNAAMQNFMMALQGAVARSNASAGQAQTLTQLAQVTPMLDFARGLMGGFATGGFGGGG